jgi:hypothetical protein
VGLSNLGSESETCVGSHVNLVGVSISFEKNLSAPIHCPPLWFAVSVLRFTSSIDGSLAACFNSKLLEDTMATAWVQKIARWDGFLSSQFGQISSPKRKTLGTSFSLFKLRLKFSDRRRKSKRCKSGENRGEPPPEPHWACWTGPAGPPCFGGRSSPVSRVPPFFAFSTHGKSWPSKSLQETPEN